MLTKCKRLITAALLLCAVTAFPNVKLPSLISNNMVQMCIRDRPYTIDTWPTINSTDASPEASNVMVNKDKTPFGIMFGDNTGTAQACRYLAEMLESAGRKEEAEKYRKKSQELLERLDHLSWNGRFYTHYIGEDITRKYNFGTDTRKQVSMSNACLLYTSRCV